MINTHPPKILGLTTASALEESAVSGRDHSGLLLARLDWRGGCHHADLSYNSQFEMRRPRALEVSR